MDRGQTVEILKALADENRLAIVRKIACDEAPTPGCELSSACVQKLSQPTMSHHIGRLVEVGVLSEKKEGTKKSYALKREALEQIGIDVTKL